MEIFEAKDLIGDSEISNKVICCDTNILISLFDKSHSWYGKTKSFFEKTKSQNIDFVYFVATNFELFEYFRKKNFTDYIRKELEKGTLSNSMGISPSAMDIVDTFCIPHKNKDSYLSDRQIKQIRNAIFQDASSRDVGITNWKNLCRISVGSGMPALTKDLKRYGIRYVNLFDKKLFSGDTRPQWEDWENLVRHYALGTEDAAILNMAESADNVYALMTNDSDMIELMQAEVAGSGMRCITFLTKYREQLKKSA